MKHTKTPWINEKEEILIEKAEEDGCLMICEMYPGNIRGLADAEFIVRAVNSHYKLLEALKKSHACATVQDDGSCGGCFVSEAIANAEGDK